MLLIYFVLRSEHLTYLINQSLQGLHLTITNPLVRFERINDEMADQTMEYKVIDFQAMKEKVEETGGKVGFFSQLLDPEIWDTALNAYAREGWTVVTSVNASFGDNGGEIIVILGRPI